MGPTELHGMKLLEGKASCAKGKFTCLQILPGLPMGKVNSEERVWFLGQMQWDTAQPQLSQEQKQLNGSENSNTPNSSDQDRHPLKWTMASLPHTIPSS